MLLFCIMGFRILKNNSVYTLLYSVVEIQTKPDIIIIFFFYQIVNKTNLMLEFYV